MLSRLYQMFIVSTEQRPSGNSYQNTESYPNVGEPHLPELEAVIVLENKLKCSKPQLLAFLVSAFPHWAKRELWEGS